ncbi:hypothetical protein NMG60_11016080 [Bertholletia excelsa]
MARQALQLFNGHYSLSPLDLLSSATASLLEARQAHAYIFKTGLFSETRLTTRLLALYVNHHCLADADLVLDLAPEPDVFSFSTVIYASSKLNRFDHVLSLFHRMLCRSVVPDSHVIPCAVKACTGLSDLLSGKQVHGISLVCGATSDSFVQSSLINMYIKSGQLTDARKMLDEMSEPNLVCWSALISGYARQGYVSDAKEAFEEMRNAGIEPNLVCWNGIITGFNQSGYYLESVSMFQKMHLHGTRPDSYSVSSVLASVGDLEDLNLGVQIHSYLIKQGIGQDICVASALIDMYGKCGCSSQMSQVFYEMEQLDIGVCNAMVTGLSRNGLVDEALAMFRQFQGNGVDLNVLSWTTMITCCTQNGKDMEALDLFREMQIVGVKPNSVTILCMIPACGNIVALMHGKAAHGFSIRRGISDVYLASALIDMYAKCGRVQLSRQCFDLMPVRNLVCWNALIGGYAIHGKDKEAIEMFHLMQKNGQKPDIVSFTCILTACSQRGLTEEGQNYFNSMSVDHRIEPQLEHYACMVSLLGRAGKLEEAYSMIKKMPYKPDACVWGALLSSCRVHNNMSLGEIAAKHLFELEPDNPGNYVLLSNIYASNGKWPEVDNVRNMLKRMGLRKNPGCSWIEVKRKMHMILAGDRSHPQMAQIIEKLGQLNMEMMKLGHLPNTDFVLQDVEEQDKEEILCGHSEKLAVVFGLLNTLPGSPLQVIKNLRICGDCHAVIKFISNFEGREIFVRDTKRFHHFKDGVCSCGDYW